MAQTSESLYRQLFQLLSKYSPKTLASSGKDTPVPEEAVALQFQFTKDGKNYGPVTVSIEDGKKLVIYYGDEVANSPSSNTSGSEYSDSWNALTQHLKSWAMRQGPIRSFERRDVSDLAPDMAKREYMSNKENVAEGYYPMGKKASYSDNVPAVKIILQHNRQLEEGEKRYRSIAKIFVENAEGERFAIPTNKPGLARVYARHIAEGGTPYDEGGKHINSLVEEYTKMAGFVRATRNGQFNESTQSLVNEAIGHYQSLRETLHKMAGRRGYQAYFENWSPTLTEDAEDTTDLSEMFANTALDPRIESVMPILSKLHKKVSESAVDKEVGALSEWADSLLSEEEGLTSNNPQGIPEEDISEAYTVVPGIDRERYQELPGLEGPFHTKSGRVVYYDKKEGKYYDPTTDMYIEYEDWQAMNEEDVEEQGMAEGANDTIYPNAEVIKSKNGKPVGEIYQDGDSWGAFHYKADRGYDFIDSREEAMEALKDLHQETGRSRPDYTTKGMAEGLDANQKRVGQVGPLEKAKNISPVLGSNPKKHPFNGKLVGADESIEEEISESEDRPYVCVHAKKGKCEVKASSSYQAAQKAAQKWGLKGTAGIDAHLADVGKDTSSLEESTDELARILQIMKHKR